MCTPVLCLSVAIHPLVLRNRYLSQHSVVYVRDIRVKAYTQFLDAYLRYGAWYCLGFHFSPACVRLSFPLPHLVSVKWRPRA